MNRWPNLRHRLYLTLFWSALSLGLLAVLVSGAVQLHDLVVRERVKACFESTNEGQYLLGWASPPSKEEEAPLPYARKNFSGRVGGGRIGGRPTWMKAVDGGDERVANMKSEDAGSTKLTAAEEQKLKTLEKEEAQFWKHAAEPPPFDPDEYLAEKSKPDLERVCRVLFVGNYIKPGDFWSSTDFYHFNSTDRLKAFGQSLLALLPAGILAGLRRWVRWLLT